MLRKKIGVLLENRFIDKEIIYYMNRFPEAGYETVLLTRLWGQPSLTFKGLEMGMECAVDKSFEQLDPQQLEEYAAVILPAGYVADYLLYAEKPGEKSPAVRFVESLMADNRIVKGFICHALWISAPAKEAFAGRRVTCHNNIVAHVENAGMTYCDQDICVDGDLITARTGGDFALFAKAVIEAVSAGRDEDV